MQVQKSRFKAGLLMLFLLWGMASFSQDSNKKISGVVNDARNQPVPAVSVVLFRKSDSSSVRGVITDDLGRFEFKRIKDGAYCLQITGLGYKKYISIPVTIDEQHAFVRLPAITLQRAKEGALTEVTVTAKKALIEEQIDRTIVNVDAMIGNAGSNALDVLSRSPGVTVAADGSITLNGNGALVLIDGKPTYLSAADLASYLRSLPAGILDKVELMTNPPAKYDAAGGTVINIRLRKNRAPGFTGSFSMGWNQGVYGRSNDVLNLNYRRNKISLFTNLSYSRNANFSDETNRRYFYNTDGTLNNAVLLNSYDRSGSNGWNGKLGMDFAATANTTFGAVLTGNTRPWDDRLDVTTNSYNGNMQLDSIGTGHTNSTYGWMSLAGNLNFQHRFGREGREISADLDDIHYSSTNNGQSYSSVTLPDGAPSGNLGFQNTAPSDIHIYSAKADYTHPLKAQAKLEAGGKYSYVRTDIATSYYDVTGNMHLPEYGQADHFIYRENINAAYVNISKEWKRLSAQAGLRAENTRSDGHQIGSDVLKDSSFSRRYTNLFPTFFFNYKLDSNGHHTLLLRYGRRIQRPGYQQLNPFLVWHDQYSYSSGNPYLNPCYNYHIELTYRYKQYFSIGAHYDHVEGIIFSTTSAEGDLFITRPENIAHGHILMMAANLNFSPLPWWNLNINGRLGNLVNRSLINSVNLDKSILVGGFNIFNQLRLKKGWSGELVGLYRSSVLSAQNVTHAWYLVNAAVQKNIWKDKASIRLLLEDVFHTQVFHEETTDILNTAAFHTSKSDSRRIGLAFSWSFGKESGTKRKRHEGNSADEEQGRVN